LGEVDADEALFQGDQLVQYLFLPADELLQSVAAGS
jgi:hypothetical protein